MTSFIVVTSMLIGGMIQWFLVRGIRDFEKSEGRSENPTVPTVDSTSFLGFPTAEVAKFAVSKLDDKQFNVNCPYCKSRKPSWEVAGCSKFHLGENEQHAIFLTCTTCASVRLVNPETIGALVPNEEEDALVWLTEPTQVSETSL